jgi:hypothetical protein
MTKTLTIKDVCVQHGISRTLFYKLQREGKGPKSFKMGRAVRINRVARSGRGLTPKRKTRSAMVRAIGPKTLWKHSGKNVCKVFRSNTQPVFRSGPSHKEGTRTCLSFLPSPITTCWSSKTAP